MSEPDGLISDTSVSNFSMYSNWQTTNSAAVLFISSRVSQISVFCKTRHSSLWFFTLVFLPASSLTYFCPHGPKVSRTIRMPLQLGSRGRLKRGWAWGPIWAFCYLLASTSCRGARHRGHPALSMLDKRLSA